MSSCEQISILRFSFFLTLSVAGYDTILSARMRLTCCPFDVQVDAKDAPTPRSGHRMVISGMVARCAVAGLKFQSKFFLLVRVMLLVILAADVYVAACRKQPVCLWRLFR